jgi:hypothetical protein
MEATLPGMRGDVVSGLLVALLVAILVAASLGTAYFTGAGNRQTVTTTSTTTVISTTISTFTPPDTSTHSIQSLDITVTNGSVPASAWQNSSSPIGHVQCGGTKPSGSGWLNLTDTGNEPLTAGPVGVYLEAGPSSTWTSYVAEADSNTQTCTINPSSSLTVYFTFYGPEPTVGEGYTLYVGVGYGLQYGFLGAIS